MIQKTVFYKNGTSQECSKCGEVTGKNELDERIHFCPYCLHTESRDNNSAKIIRDRGRVVVRMLVEMMRRGSSSYLCLN